MVGRILAAALLVLSASPAQAAEVSVLSSTALTTDPVGELVVSGEGELGVQPIPELKAVPGVEIVGPLPGDLQTVTVLTAGVGAHSKDPAAARAFIKFLTCPAAMTVITATGMDKG